MNGHSDDCPCENCPAFKEFERQEEARFYQRLYEEAEEARRYDDLLSPPTGSL